MLYEFRSSIFMQLGEYLLYKFTTYVNVECYHLGVGHVTQLHLRLRHSQNDIRMSTSSNAMSTPLKTLLAAMLLLLCDLPFSIRLFRVSTDYHSTRPTFIFLKGGVKVDQVKGANKA